MPNELQAPWALDRAARKNGFASWQDVPKTGRIRNLLLNHAETIAELDTPPDNADAETLERILAAFLGNLWTRKSIQDDKFFNKALKQFKIEMEARND